MIKTTGMKRMKLEFEGASDQEVDELWDWFRSKCISLGFETKKYPTYNNPNRLKNVSEHTVQKVDGLHGFWEVI